MTETIELAQTRKPKEKIKKENLHAKVLYGDLKDWSKKLGANVYTFWLELRTHMFRDDDDKSEWRIKMPMGKLRAEMGMAKATFYRRIAPLYEYGLIDFVEYETVNGTAENIVVHETPIYGDGKHTVLQKVRSWAERTTKKFSHTLLGGKKKSAAPKQTPVQIVEEPVLEKPINEVPVFDVPVHEEPEYINYNDIVTAFYTNETVAPPVQTAAPAPKEVKQPTKEVLVDEELISFEDDMPQTIVSTFEMRKDELKANKVNLNIVVRWINKRALSEITIIEVIHKLADYTDVINNTASFLKSTIERTDEWKKIDALRIQGIEECTAPTTVTVNNEEEIQVIEAPVKPKVTFYNWLEERE